jgi:hypothetical protein
MKIIIQIVFGLFLQLKIFLTMKGDLEKRKKLSGDNIGVNLYNGQVTTQAMKRPQRWFFNVLMHKPNDKYFREAEYNGLRYQTEMLQDNLEKEYNNYVRDFYDEKLKVYENKMIETLKQNKKNRLIK